MASSSSTTRILGFAASIAELISRVLDQAIDRALPLALPAVEHHLAGALASLELLEHWIEEAGLVGVAPARVAQPGESVACELGEIARHLEHRLVAVARREPASRDVPAPRL